MLIKVIKFTIKFKIFDFHYPHIPFCNFQNSVSKKMWCCLTFVCVYIWHWEPDCRPIFLLQAACASMCRHKYNWNIIEGDIKLPIKPKPNQSDNCKLLRFYHTSWVDVVTQNDRPKSVRNRCVVEVFGGVFVWSSWFFDFLWVKWFLIIGPSQISSFHRTPTSVTLSRVLLRVGPRTDNGPIFVWLFRETSTSID